MAQQVSPVTPASSNGRRGLAERRVGSRASGIGRGLLEMSASLGVAAAPCRGEPQPAEQSESPRLVQTRLTLPLRRPGVAELGYQVGEPLVWWGHGESD
jgi:hypothetical protein